MMNLYGAPGMGAAGTGFGMSPQVPGAGGGMSPQLMQLMASMQGGGGGGMPGGAVPPPPGPLGAPPTGTPMANYIGASMPPGGGMQHPMPPPMPQGDPMQGGAAPAAGMAGGMGALNPQMLMMLQALKGQQTGVSPGGGPTVPPSGAPPAQMAPGMGGGTGPLAPGLDALLRRLGMYGGVTGGAPT